MKNSKKYYLLLFLSLFLFSCKENNHQDKEKLIVDDTLNTNIDVKITTKPKIFLKYWEDMSYNEFKEVSLILKTEKIINFEELHKSSSEQDIFKIPQKNQKELTEKGETEFMIITKTIVTLKK